jgi:hypothetical protein
MFELAWVGVPAALVGFLYFVVLGHRLLPVTEDQTETEARASRSYQFDLRVPDDSPLVGQSIEKAGLRHLEDAFLAHMHRRGLCSRHLRWAVPRSARQSRVTSE